MKYILKLWSESVPEKPWWFRREKYGNRDRAKATRFPTREAAEAFRGTLLTNAMVHGARAGLEPLVIEVLPDVGPN